MLFFIGFLPNAFSSNIFCKTSQLGHFITVNLNKTRKDGAVQLYSGKVMERNTSPRGRKNITLFNDEVEKAATMKQVPRLGTRNNRDYSLFTYFSWKDESFHLTFKKYGKAHSGVRIGGPGEMPGQLTVFKKNRSKG